MAQVEMTSRSAYSSPVAVGDFTKPVQNPGDNPEVTWWCRLLVRVAAVFAGVVAAIFGIWTCVSIHPLCIVAGIFQIIGALLLLVFEAPICCQFIEITKPIASFAEQRTFLQKAFLYAGMAIPPVAMCIGVSTIVGCALVFATGVLYGLMALGRKADRSTMMARASGDDDKAAIIPNDELQNSR